MVVIIFVDKNFLVSKNKIPAFFSEPFFFIDNSYVNNFLGQKRFQENKSEDQDAEDNYYPEEHRNFGHHL